MRKPTLEFLRWILEFRRRNSNVQHGYSKSNLGIPRLGNRLLTTTTDRRGEILLFDPNKCDVWMICLKYVLELNAKS